MAGRDSELQQELEARVGGRATYNGDSAVGGQDVVHACEECSVKEMTTHPVLVMGRGGLRVVYKHLKPVTNSHQQPPNKGQRPIQPRAQSAHMHTHRTQGTAG